MDFRLVRLMHGRWLGRGGPSLRCRPISTSVFGEVRVPLLEELLEAPILKKGTLDAQSLATIKDYIPPMLLDQVEASLCHEFGRHFLHTKWDRYEDPIRQAEHEQAARLLQMTLATMKSALRKLDQKGFPKDGGRENIEWLKRECDLLLREIEEGTIDRWTDMEALLGSERCAGLSAAQKMAIQPAVLLVGKNPHLYPTIKSALLEEIHSIILATIK